MNGYELTRQWYNFKFENVVRATHVHSDLYFYIIDLWNRLGQKKEFGLPTTITMECVGIKSYNTYKRTIDDLIEFGFIKEVKKSVNQYNSRIIALSKIDKANNKALDKALNNPIDKALDSIIEQQTTNNKINNIDERKLKFADTLKPFLDMYGKDMLNDFYKYWTEPNKSKTKYRMELEKTWDLGRRLETWAKNDKNFNKPIEPQKPSAPSKLFKVEDK